MTNIQEVKNEKQKTRESIFKNPKIDCTKIQKANIDIPMRIG